MIGQKVKELDNVVELNIRHGPFTSDLAMRKKKNKFS